MSFVTAERMLKQADEIEQASKDDIDAVNNVWDKPRMQTFVDEQVKYLQHGIDEMM